jgi:hypothetical protein
MFYHTFSKTFRGLIIAFMNLKRWNLLIITYNYRMTFTLAHSFTLYKKVVIIIDAKTSLLSEPEYFRWVTWNLLHYTVSLWLACLSTSVAAQYSKIFILNHQFVELPHPTRTLNFQMVYSMQGGSCYVGPRKFATHRFVSNVIKYPSTKPIPYRVAHKDKTVGQQG